MRTVGPSSAAPPLGAVAVDDAVGGCAVGDLAGATDSDVDGVPGEEEWLMHLGVAARVRERETVAAVAILRPDQPRVDDGPVGLRVAEYCCASLDDYLCTRSTSAGISMMPSQRTAADLTRVRADIHRAGQNCLAHRK